jgi:hypothetical protein
MQEKLAAIKQYAKENERKILERYHPLDAIDPDGENRRPPLQEVHVHSTEVQALFSKDPFDPSKLPGPVLIILGDLGVDPKGAINLVYEREKKCRREGQYKEFTHSQKEVADEISTRAQDMIYHCVWALPKEVLLLPGVIVSLRSQIMQLVLEGDNIHPQSSTGFLGAFNAVANIAYKGKEKDSPKITTMQFAKREIGRLNKEGKSPEDIADYMLQRADYFTMKDMCEQGRGLVKGGRTVLEYLLLFINKIFLGKDVTGIKAQDEARENVQKELNKRLKEPSGGGRGAE